MTQKPQIKLPDNLKKKGYKKIDSTSKINDFQRIIVTFDSFFWIIYILAILATSH